MKSLLLTILLAFPFQIASAQSVWVQPNQCLDGNVYRALVGENVKTDAAGNKTLSVDGRTLIDCQVGNTTTCVGTTYNNYTCRLNFVKVSGDAAKAVASNVDFGQEKGLTITSNYVGDYNGCEFMHCVREQVLTCDNGSCEIKAVMTGWDE